MERNERVVLNEFKSKEKNNSNIILKHDFVNSHNIIPIEPLEEEVDISQVFTDERDNSNCYRFIGNLNVIATNALFNWDGSNSYNTILNLMDFDEGDPESTNEYVFAQDEILKEKDGWFYYLNSDELNCQKTYLEPVPDRFYPLNTLGDANWDVWLTYPKYKDLLPLTFNGVDIQDGIAVYSGTTITIDNRQMTAFICSINHGLNVGDEVLIQSNPISPTTDTGYEGIFNIYALGFGDGTYVSNTFIIDYVIPGGVPSGLFKNTRTSFKRRVEGIESEYHGRWFEKISKQSEVELHNTAFARNIYKDTVYSYIFNKEYDTNLYRDYLNRPLTEIYVTIVKKQNIFNNRPFWTALESGLKTVITNSEYDINTINSITNNDSIENNLYSNTISYFGDIVEYNPVDQTEIVLEIAYHRFNTENREAFNNFLEGYYYRPHYRQQIRKLSDYVEISTDENDDVPDYATDLGDGRRIWRDVLPNDFSNTENIPYLNGCHYVYNNITLAIQRQDPCGIYNSPNMTIIPGRCDDDIIQFTQTTPENNFCE
jgi:hypothetical protein